MTALLTTNGMVDGTTHIMVEAIGISKSFRFAASGRPSTLKDLVLQRVRFDGHYGIVDALQDVNFSLKRGQSLGVIGENGSGKTTLLRILAGITQPDSGAVRIGGTVAPLLSVGAGFNPYLSGRENALIELLTLGMTRTEAQAQIDDVVAFSELAEFIDAPLRSYSAGMTMRLAFAAAIRVDPDVLLIDEVFAVGDERFAAKCTAWLADFKARGKTTILVTHDSHAVAAQCDIALWLDKGHVAAFGERMDVIRAYARATSGKPVADAVAPRAASLESATAMADTYRARIAGLLPLLRLPLIGYVRQTGKNQGWIRGRLDRRRARVHLRAAARRSQLGRASHRSGRDAGQKRGRRRSQRRTRRARARFRREDRAALRQAHSARTIDQHAHYVGHGQSQRLRHQRRRAGCWGSHRRNRLRPLEGLISPNSSSALALFTIVNRGHRFLDLAKIRPPSR